MKKSTFFTALTVLVLIPATLYYGSQLRGKWHYLVSTLIILETMLPFFVSFESRRPQARELVTIAVSAFASNFFYSQGPWTPWQMMGYGMGGFLAGLLFYNRVGRLRQNAPVFAAILAVFGFVTIVGVVGPLLDCSSLFLFSGHITVSYALAVFASGFPINLTHGISCAVTMLLLGKPLLSKLERLKTKYGMMKNSYIVQK